jgi:predicted membrane protein
MKAHLITSAITLALIGTITLFYFYPDEMKKVVTFIIAGVAIGALYYGVYTVVVDETKGKAKRKTIMDDTSQHIDTMTEKMFEEWKKAYEENLAKKWGPDQKT